MILNELLNIVPNQISIDIRKKNPVRPDHRYIIEAEA